MSDSTYALRARELVFRYDGADRDSIKGVSLDIKAGEFVCVLGRNGSGKSTLGKLMNALLTPTEGTLEVFGTEATDDKTVLEVRKNCGMVFQDPDNQMVATIVEEDVAFGCENLGLPSEEIQKRVAEALEITGMTEYAGSAPHMLSGGQKQRVAIAGIIAMRHRMIIFDESTSMLDPSGRKDIFELAARLNAEGMTVVWITHFMEEATCCPRVVIVDDGKLVMDADPKMVFADTERIESLGLEVPEMTLLAHRLNESGVAVSPDIITMDEMEEELCRLASEI